MNEINKEERMQGLSGQQVSESKAKYGTNELAKKETESLWSMFIGAFDDIWIKVLCAALALKVILVFYNQPFTRFHHFFLCLCTILPLALTPFQDIS